MPDPDPATPCIRVSRRAAKPTATAIASALWLLLPFIPQVRAQIIPDSTLPNNSIVTPSGNTFTIEGGTTAGDNLFHSFQEFSVPAGREAFFNNAAQISNILTRVTGGKISNIDGLIRANGNANLFLINPNGIVFGENARLNIGGSFFGTTANSIVFDNGVEFGAAAGEGQPLLTVNVPIGLQWGGQTGRIRVRGDGHGLTAINPISLPISRENSNLGLQVTSGNTLALVGGDVRLNGAALTAEGGRIEVGGVGVGFVGLIAPSSADSNQWHLNYDEVSRFQDVRLLEQSAVDVSGTGVGSMQIVGEQITLRDGSIALLQNQGTQPFGKVRVQASEFLTLTGTTTDGLIPSGFRQETLGAGNASNLEISTQRLAIREGGQIFNRTQAGGQTGDINIQASESISLVNRSPINPTVGSLIGISSLGTGAGGNITVSTGNLNIRGGATLASSTSGTGAGGNIFVNATEAIRAIGANPQINTPSVISSTSFGVGNAGSVTLNANSAIVRGGGQIGSVAVASGDSGTVVLNATELVEVSGTLPGSNLPSQINGSTNQPGERFQVLFGLPPIPSGFSGNVEINTPRLNLKDGGQVTVRNEGTGSAGNIEVNAETIFLKDGGNLTAATLSGEGGNIQLSLDDSLLLRNGSFISAEAGDAGNGGNITINTETIALLENSTITANAFEGNGGNIQITTRGIFVSPDSSITASSEFGVDGIVEITNPDVDSAAAAVELEPNPLDPSDRIVTGCASALENSLIVTGRGGLPANPSWQLRGDRSWPDLRDLSAFRGQNTTSTPQKNAIARLVEANGWIVHLDGKIELVAMVGNPQKQQLPFNCAAKQFVHPEASGAKPQQPIL